MKGAITEETLVQYSMRFFANDEDQKETARHALYALLTMAARAVEHGEPKTLAEFTEITIVLKKKRWDRWFELRIEPVQK